MSDTQAKKLLEDWDEEDKQKDKLEEALTKPGGVKVTVPVNIDKVKYREFVWLGTYDLAENDKIYYKVSAKSGIQMDIGFAKPGNENPGTMYQTVSNMRTDGRKLEVRSGPLVWKKPLKPGKYRLFVHTQYAQGADLEKVSGTVVIVKAEKN